MSIAWPTRIKTLLLALALLGSGASPVFAADRAAALSGSDFKAGRIIDDVVFFNGNDLSLSQIQQFLNAKLPTCDINGTASKSYYYNASTGRVNNSADTWVTTTRAVYGQRYNTYNGVTYAAAPYTCLKDYRTDTGNRSAEAGLCTGYTAANQSAAEIIYNVARSCGVSARALIVLLQKEQGLITDDWPWGIQYRSATGFGCPDTAACDSQYYGFFNQVYSAARMFKRYAQAPSNYNYLANRNNFILYNPSSSCGGSDVFIENQATAGLYNYTPYQPNPSALAAMNDSTPGGTVPCGAYGNRNFFWYFTQWFGPTLRGLITTRGDGIYVVENGTKRPFPNEITFLSYGYKWSDVLSISNVELNSIPDGPVMTYNTHYRDGHLVTSPGLGMLIIEDGLKRPFPNEAIFSTYNYAYTDAIVISNLELSLIPEGAPLAYDTGRRNGFLVKVMGGGIYVVDSGTKRPFPNEETFLSYRYTWADAAAISSAEMGLIPEGMPMPYRVNFRNGFLVSAAGGGIYVVDSGTKRPFPNEETFFSYGYTFSDALVITATELKLIPEGVPMPLKQ